MEYSLDARSKYIVEACLKEKHKNPIEIFQKIANKEFIRIHGPEHHILDGAALSIIDGTGPLSEDASWGKHMMFTSKALGKKYLSDNFECYSAGTETKPQINQDAVRIMKELYNIDMEENQYSKLLSDIPNPDIAISMGCNVGCPFIGRDFDDNWGLEDPTGKSDEDFRAVIKEIESKIINISNLTSTQEV